VLDLCERPDWRVSAKEESREHAKDFAEDWYLPLKGKSQASGLNTGDTITRAAEQFPGE
jgi:hypothetical protein